MTISYRVLQGITLVVVAGVLSFARAAFVSGVGEPILDTQEQKVRRFLDRIKADQQARNVADLQALSKDIDEQWPAKKDAGYFRVVRELCKALNSTGIVDSSRTDLVRKLATAALDAPQVKPIEDEVGLLLTIQADRDYIRGSLRNEAWRAERLIRVGRWLRVWRLLGEEKVRWDKEIDGPVYGNVRPPRETGLPAGVSPKHINDPALRKKYEEAIAQNAERARINRKKSDLKDLESRFAASLKRYIINAYSNPPFANEELEKLLAESGLDANTRADIVKEVKKRETAQMEREVKQPPPPHVQFTEPVVPPEAPTYHADPRLRVKVSFDLKAPLVDDVLHELHQATKVSLTRADDIRNQYPAHGSLSFRSIPAWQVMDTLAQSKRVEGRWEKEGDGYRLVRNGNPLSIPEASEEGTGGSSSGNTLLLVVAAVGLILGLGYWWVRRHRHRTPTST